MRYVLVCVAEFMVVCAYVSMQTCIYFHKLYEYVPDVCYVTVITNVYTHPQHLQHCHLTKKKITLIS